MINNLCTFWVWLKPSFILEMLPTFRHIFLAILFTGLKIFTSSFENIVLFTCFTFNLKWLLDGHFFLKKKWEKNKGQLVRPGNIFWNTKCNSPGSSIVLNMECLVQKRSRSSADASDLSTKSCPENETWSSCSETCTAYCNGPVLGSIRCAKDCASGCNCNTGFFRHLGKCKTPEVQCMKLKKWSKKK